ncbi:hypothetical protein [Chryseobacterium arthrosphaerae]|uniref:hypothetical protein n=1 Tax=Chryseobacterium arthrosphaerae TaxID=651561 RepID=UPI0031D24D88
MEKKLSRYYLVFLNISILVYSLYICWCIFTERAVLSDDLAGVYQLRTVPDSYFSYIYSFLDSSLMAARPVSGLVTGTLSFLSKDHESLYLLGILFFPFSLAVLYWVARHILSKELASLFTLLYATSLIGSSIQFSSIMLNSNLATIFFALSIYYVYTRKNTILSALFFITSVLSYEIFLPFIVLHLFLIKDHKKKVVFGLLTLGIIVIFRKIIQPALFVNSYQRDEITKVFELKRVIFVAVCAVKLFFRDLFEGIWKGILNIRKLHILEILLALIISSVVYKVFAGYDFKSRVQELKKLSIISFISILFGLSIFLFSSYIPTLFGFDNRNLGAIRLFYTLFIISGIIYLSVRLKLSGKTISIFLAGMAFILVITNISLKNSWIYASKFNNQLFRQLNIALKQNNISEGNVCIDYGVFEVLKSDPDLMLREPLFYKYWESPMLSQMNGIDPEKIHVYNIENQKNCGVTFQYKNGKMIRTK